MFKTLSLAALPITLVALVVVFDHYWFLRRISKLDPKSFYHQVQILAAAKTNHERDDAIAAAQSSPEFADFRVALAGDHIVLLHTHSLTSDAYLAFEQLGSSNGWVVGWLRRGRFSQIGTHRF